MDRGDQFQCSTNGEWITRDEAYLVWPSDQPRPVDVTEAFKVTCYRCAEHHIARNNMQAEPYMEFV